MQVKEQLPVRMDMGVNEHEHERLSRITIRHTFNKGTASNKKGHECK
jgi:hypothetical protein